MKKDQPFNIVIAGAGGIGRAVGLLLAAAADFDSRLFLGDKDSAIATDAAGWINEGCDAAKATAFVLNPESESAAMEEIFSAADIVLDCLPGHFAPAIGRLARKHNLHYINLTEHVKETEQLKEIAQDAPTGFILQTGLAPGFINILACHLYNQFVELHQNREVEYIGMKVGALTRHAIAPHFYGLTWSPIGVATEYFKNAIIIRNYKKASVPSLSEQAEIFIDNNRYEENYTSGGAADLPDAFEGLCRRLDYKTLRYPGHYNWVKSIVKKTGNAQEAIETLEKQMLSTVPFVQEDKVVLYAVVRGMNKKGQLQAIERSFVIEPVAVGKHTLRAIQATTAAPMAECARMLLTGNYKGLILQSHIDTKRFLDGPFIRAIYFNEQKNLSPVAVLEQAGIQF